MKSQFIGLMIGAVFLSGSAAVFAQATAGKPFVSPLFTDNMVLQRGMADPIWGWSVPGDKITIALDKTVVKTVAAADGAWMAKLPPLPAGGPHTISVAGAQTAKLQNVLEGDVWICSGQSNMEFGVENLDNPDQVIAAANYPEIRLNCQHHQMSNTPMATNVGSWLICTPDSIKVGTWNGFSAVAYYFGRALYQKLHVPIGLIESNWGGTVAEAWTSPDALRKNLPEFSTTLDQIDQVARNSTAQSNPQIKIDWNSPGELFNGMISPLIPYGIKGVIWYQGESNAGRSKQYRVLLPTLISDWRQRWGQGPFFFDIVSLANNGQNTMPGADGDGMQAIRDAQMDTVETTINTGIAITDDIGDAVSDHPKDKVDVGSRLALAALAKGYGQKITYSGPVYTGSKIVGNQIIILFDHADGGLVAKGGGPLTGFSICDVHQNWVWADAKIDGANVDVSSSSIANPTAALFAWADNPSFNLYNGAGLPAAPFRTDRPAAGPY